MDQDMLSAATALRDKAFATFKAFDDAVISLGGVSRLDMVVKKNALAEALGDRVRRQTQTGAAEVILRERGSPMTVHELMAALPSKGVTLGGGDPQVNFTSSLSKSGKFQSVRHNGKYYWWFKDEMLPVEWLNKEAPDLLSEEGSDASVIGNQEGGEANATAT
jgi:hypothetical protein